jgi:uncharacterized protein
VNEAELNRLLQAGNTWWRARSWERDDPDLRRIAEVPFTYEPEPLGDIAPPSLYELRGPRRVGKTAEVKRAISRLISQRVDARQIIHFACDGLGASDLRRLVKVGRELATRGVEGPRYWFLDEITAIKGWPAEIKWLRDNTELSRDCVVLTGSSARDLEDARKELVGRRGSTAQSERVLLPMSFRAFCAAAGPSELPASPVLRGRDFHTREAEDAIYELQPWLDDLVLAWELYLQVGGFPRAVSDQLRHHDVRPDFINDLWSLIHGDAIKSARFTGAQTNALLVRLAKNLASPVNMSAVAGDVGVGSHHTARERVRELIQAYVAWPSYKLGDQKLPNLGAQEKVYFTDPLFARLAELRNEGARALDSSVLSEQQLGLALLRGLESEHPGSYANYTSVMYRRTATGKEVDFVGPALEPVIYEGKYTDRNLAREKQTVATQSRHGVLATRSVLDTRDGVWCAPAPFVAYLLND